MINVQHSAASMEDRSDSVEQGSQACANVHSTSSVEEGEDSVQRQIAPASTTRCRFLELSVEIRNRVYEAVLCRGGLFHLTIASYTPGGVNPYLTRVGRQIRREAYPLFLSQNRFMVDINSTRHATLKRVLGPLQDYAAYFKHLTLRSSVDKNVPDFELDLPDNGLVGFKLHPEVFTGKAVLPKHEKTCRQGHAMLECLAKRQVQEDGLEGEQLLQLLKILFVHELEGCCKSSENCGVCYGD